MVDLHTHILPGIDDGAKTMDDALQMARMAANDGVTTVVATPHAYWEGAVNGDPVITSGVAELTQAIEAEGISLRIVPGAEVPIEKHLVSKLERHPNWTIGGQNVYLLLEPPWGPIPDYSDALVSELMERGITPIIAHPERSPDLQAHPALLDGFISLGALTQVTANSILGRHGSTAKNMALKLLKSGKVHVISSDSHNCKNRAPVLAEARQEVESLLGAETGFRLFEQNPQRIVDGMALDAFSTQQDNSPSEAKGLGKLFSRFRRGS